MKLNTKLQTSNELKMEMKDPAKKTERVLVSHTETLFITKTRPPFPLRKDILKLSFKISFGDRLPL